MKKTMDYDELNDKVNKAMMPDVKKGEKKMPTSTDKEDMSAKVRSNKLNDKMKKAGGKSYPRVVVQIAMDKMAGK